MPAVCMLPLAIWASAHCSRVRVQDRDASTNRPGARADNALHSTQCGPCDRKWAPSPSERDEAGANKQSTHTTRPLVPRVSRSVVCGSAPKHGSYAGDLARHQHPEVFTNLEAGAGRLAHHAGTLREGHCAAAGAVLALHGV